MADIQIKNSNVNSGSYVNLQSASFTPGNLRKMIQVEPIAGQRAGSSTTFTISKGDRLGIENPIHRIRGYINTLDFASSAALWTSTTTDVNLGFLYALWRDMTGTTYIKLPFGFQDSSGSLAQFYWRPFDSSATDEIPVEISSLSFQPDAGSEGQHLVNYEIVCTEVRTS